MLAVADGVVAVCTARIGDVPVAVEVSGDEPPADRDAWDHIAECSISLDVGGMLLAGGTDFILDEAHQIDLPPGSYRVRVSFGGLDDLPEPPTSAWDEESFHDRYRLQLWPGPATEPRVLKQMRPEIAARMEGALYYKRPTDAP
jgi:hypothetical protein